MFFVCYTTIIINRNSEYLSAVTPPIIEKDPCVPSPCGSFSQCRSIGGSPACTCLENYIGQPPNCRPECIIHSECPSDKACINMKCVDPCPGSCGTNALCSVINHIPTCRCPEGYTGNTFILCEIVATRKLSRIIQYATCFETGSKHNSSSINSLYCQYMDCIFCSDSISSRRPLRSFTLRSQRGMLERYL